MNMSLQIPIFSFIYLFIYFWEYHAPKKIREAESCNIELKAPISDNGSIL